MATTTNALIEALQQAAGQDPAGTTKKAKTQKAPGSLPGATGAYGLRQIGTLDPNQSSVADWLTNVILQGPQAYGGTLNAVTNPLLNKSAASITDLIGTPLDASYYQRAVADPAIKQFQEQILPGLREDYVGTGNFWSKARAGAESKAASDLAAALASGKAQFEMDSRDKALQAAGLGAQVGTTMQALDQEALNRIYQDWLRQQPENSQMMNMALQFLGIPTTATFQEPPKDTSAWEFGGNIIGSILAGLLKKTLGL